MFFFELWHVKPTWAQYFINFIQPCFQRVRQDFVGFRVRGIKKTSFNSPFSFADAVFLESKSHMFVDWFLFSFSTGIPYAFSFIAILRVMFFSGSSKKNSQKVDKIIPQKLRWIPKMMVLKVYYLLSNMAICRKSMLDFPGGSKPGLRILISAIPKVAIVFLMGIARIIQLSTFSHIMSKS